MAIRSTLTKYLVNRSFRFPFPGRIQTNEAHSSAFLPKKLFLAPDWEERFLAPKDTFSHQHPALFCSFADNNSDQQTEGNVETNQSREEIQSRTLRIRGIPWSSTEEDVRNFFGQYAPSIKDFNFTFHERGKFWGEAYVEFSDANSCKEAFRMHRNKIGSRYIEIFSLQEWDLDEMLKLRDAAPPSPVVFIRGLPFRCTEDDISSFFHGLEVVPNGIAMSGSGQACVQFVDHPTLDKALRRDKEYVDVCRSSQEQLNWARGFSDVPRSAHGVGGGRSVKMLGLPYSAEAVDIIQFFKPLDVVDVELLVHRGRPSGSAVVRFQSHEDAVKAMKKHREYIGERYVELRLEDSGRDRD